MADVARSPIEFSPVNRRGARSSADTSQDTPLVLLAAAAATAPFVNLPSISVGRSRKVAVDTSRGMPKTLFADATTPIIPVQFGLASRAKKVAADTSQDTPKTLYDDDFIPVVNAYLELSTPYRRQVLSNTSAGTPTTLLPLPPLEAPFVPAPQFSIKGRAALGADTSQGTPAVLLPIEEITAPFFVLPDPFAGKPRVIGIDTSQEMPKTLFADAIVPITNVPQYRVDRRGPPGADTSQQSFILIYPPPPPPVAGVASPSGDNKKLRAKLRRRR